jgi:hypothetical protein
VLTLEFGLREVFSLNGMSRSNPHAPYFVGRSHKIAYALKALEAIKFEREKGMYPGQCPDHDNHDEYASTIYNAGSITDMEIEATSLVASEPPCPADSTHHFLLSTDECAASNTVSNGFIARNMCTVSSICLFVTEEIYFSHSAIKLVHAIRGGYE